MTSLEIIREVMNVPMEAVHAIARMNGISTADDHKRNITVKQLKPFADAFERKTRNYFVNSMRNSAQLNTQELQTFTEFCKTFKKENISLDKVTSWSHIGKTKLREYFVDRIKEKTSSSPDHFTIFDLFSGCGGMTNILERDISKIHELRPIDNIAFSLSSGYYCHELEHTCEVYRRQPSQNLLCKINSSWQYRARIESNVYYYKYVPDFIKQVILSARYYIYIDDEDDHPSDTVSAIGHNDLIINSTCRMGT